MPSIQRNWQIGRLLDEGLIHLVEGTGRNSEARGDDAYPMLRPSDLVNDRVPLGDLVVAQESGHTIVRMGDVCVALVLQPGVSRFIYEEPNCVLARGIVAFRNFDRSINPLYFAEWAQTGVIELALARTTRGGHMRYARLADLREVAFPFVDRQEQDALVARMRFHRETLDIANEMKQAAAERLKLAQMRLLYELANFDSNSHEGSERSHRNVIR